MVLRGTVSRGAALALVAAGVLAGCGGTNGLAQVLQTASGVAAFTLDSATLYVVGVPATGTVTAYRLRDGRQSWRVPDIPGAAGLTSTTAVLSSYPARCADDEDLTFTMLDAASGAAHWRHAGTPLGASADGAWYLREHGAPPGCTGGGTDMRAPADDDAAPAGGAPSAGGAGAADDRLVAVDAATGTVRWARPLDPSTVLAAVMTGPGSASGASRVAGPVSVAGLVTLASDGTLQSLDPATGTPRATSKPAAAATTAATAAARGAAPALRLIVTARTLMLAAPLGTGAVGLSGFDPVTLTPQWTVQLPPPADVTYQPCGELLCAQGPDSTTAVDPATGSVRWQLDGLVRQAGHRIAVAGQVPATDSTRLVDVATGRVTRTLAHSTVVGAAGRAAQLVLGRSDGGRTTFSLLDLDTGDLRELGSAAGQYDSCQVTTGYLACRATDSAVIRLWRVR
jgi:outer membrane protein assembly factor BamB